MGKKPKQIDIRPLTNSKGGDTLLNMKSTYTMSEATSFITQVLKDRIGCDTIVVEIIPDTDLVGSIINKIGLVIAMDRKIWAIKTLREIYQDTYKESMGLADAKWAVEHWDIFLQFVREHSRFPSGGYSSNGQLR